MVSMLEEVMQTGTAAGVRSRGFTLPAAGKTGTSHDGWFAGFTSNLLCIVWVGFDDNRELDIEGARSALPIWTEFMKRATSFRRYADVKPFEAPDGVVSITIDPASGMPATPACPEQKSEVFIAGTEPVGACPLHGGKGGDRTTVSGWDTGSPQVAPTPYQAAPDNPPARRADSRPPAAPSALPPPAVQLDQPEQQKKKGFFSRLKNVFK
jgi:penicillin-binding protein 1B